MKEADHQILDKKNPDCLIHSFIHSFIRNSETFNLHFESYFLNYESKHTNTIFGQQVADYTYKLMVKSSATLQIFGKGAGPSFLNHKDQAIQRVYIKDTYKCWNNRKFLYSDTTESAPSRKYTFKRCWALGKNVSVTETSQPQSCRI